jgi:beta-glucosidase
MRGVTLRSVPDRLSALPFLWGAATSAHQVEGGNTANDWYEWERAAGTPCAEPAGAAAEHFTRYPQDLALLAGLGLNCYRFSIEWSRVEPADGRFSPAAIAHYRRMLEACHARGLIPLATLHHFTNPRWVAAQGGWESPHTAIRFARYARRLAAELGTLMPIVITINEPNIPPLLGYELGVFPPGRRDRQARLRVSEVFIDGHRRAVEALRAELPSVPVGLALAMADWQALPGGERERDEWRRLREDIFLAATDGDDFIGVNTYTRHLIGPHGWVGNEPGVELTAAGYEFWPEALEATLRRAWELRRPTPLIATESGIAADDDARRVEYIDRAVAGLDRARAGGVDVRGYIYWSALDNFEWHCGYVQRFGLIGIDRSTQERLVRPSARHLGDLARRRTGSHAIQA